MKTEDVNLATAKMSKWLLVTSSLTLISAHFTRSLIIFYISLIFHGTATFHIIFNHIPGSEDLFLIKILVNKTHKSLIISSSIDNLNKKVLNRCLFLFYFYFLERLHASYVVVHSQSSFLTVKLKQATKCPLQCLPCNNNVSLDTDVCYDLIAQHLLTGACLLVIDLRRVMYVIQLSLTYLTFCMSTNNGFDGSTAAYKCKIFKSERQSLITTHHISAVCSTSNAKHRALQMRISVHTTKTTAVVKGYLVYVAVSRKRFIRSLSQRFLDYG